MRHRKKLLGDRNRCVNRLIKALVLMNIKVQNVISDIDGKTGKAIINAIANGETDPGKLADLADTRIKATKEELIKSLEGDWNEHQLFILKQQNTLYKYLSDMIQATDLQVEYQLKRILAWQNGGQVIEVDIQQKRKRTTAKNHLPFNATAYLQTLLLTDLTTITGISELSALTFISEVGMNMDKWPSVKNFRSWLNIAPTTEVTGGKIQSEKIKKRFHHAGQVLRIAAITVRNTNTPLGHIFRKNIARGGPSKAILATADKMATAIYHMIKNRQPFDPLAINKNPRKGTNQSDSSPRKKAKKT
jgi:hypothetical protein